jgi:hypothetical protein
MGGEADISKWNITITILLGVFALMLLSWRLALMALLFGGPGQWAIRTLSEDDEDALKAYFQGLFHPHIRRPE